MKSLTRSITGRSTQLYHQTILSLTRLGGLLVSVLIHYQVIHQIQNKPEHTSLTKTTTRSIEIVMQLRQSINAHKALTSIFVLCLMLVYDKWTSNAYVYLALHGTYGLLWLVKDSIYPDVRFEKKESFVRVFAMLALYWVAPLCLVQNSFECPNWVIGLSITLVIIGTFFHFGSDAQKYFVLQCKRELIIDGFFGLCRHPNYFGEMLIYSGFAVLSMSWIPWIVLILIWCSVFAPSIQRKESSLARYEKWKSYAATTPVLIPNLHFSSRFAACRPR